MKMKECEFDMGVCQTHGYSEDEEKWCVKAMHEELHKALLMDFDYRQYNSEEEYLRHACKFCTEEN